jgi:uncharacterized damage-inducible protein DinB
VSCACAIGGAKGSGRQGGQGGQVQVGGDGLHAQQQRQQLTATRTLNHIYVVDRIFRAHLAGEPHGYTATNTRETPALNELWFQVGETDAWFEQYVATVTSEALAESIAFRFTDGDTGRMTREEMLAHVITHGAYHRGNVGQVLKGISVAPPRDLLTKFLHVSEPARREG